MIVKKNLKKKKDYLPLKLISIITMMVWQALKEQVRYHELKKKKLQSIVKKTC